MFITAIFLVIDMSSSHPQRDILVGAIASTAELIELHERKVKLLRDMKLGLEQKLSGITGKDRG